MTVKMTKTVENFTNSQSWAFLLQNYEEMNVKDSHYTSLNSGYSPMNRPILEYIKYGLVNIDKTKGPSSHEIVTWVKDLFNKFVTINKTGHCGTLDPQVSGCLTILIERSTRLSKIGQSEGKEYICVLGFLSDSEYVIDKKKLLAVLEKLSGEVFQRPPLMCAVKRELRLRKIYKIELLEIHNSSAILRVNCEAGTYIRTLCVHIGLLMGCQAHMKDLRRSKSGVVSEDILYSMHDLLDAIMFYHSLHFLNNSKQPMVDKELYIRRVVQPLESILTHLKRIIIKDTAVNAICYGGQLTIKGILRYDDNINRDDTIVIVSTKGEAVAIAIATLSTAEIHLIDHGIVCKTKRVIMERDTYPRSWKMSQNAGQVVEIIENYRDNEDSGEIQENANDYSDEAEDSSEI